jgi:hypothetical protein
MLSVNIKLSRLREDLLYHGKNGETYLNLILVDKEDRFGNLTVIQPVSREAYASGERGEAVGTWKDLGVGSKQQSTPAKTSFDLAKYKSPKESFPPTAAPPEEDDIPF